MGALQVLFPSDPKMDSIGFHGIWYAKTWQISRTEPRSRARLSFCGQTVSSVTNR